MSASGQTDSRLSCDIPLPVMAHELSNSRKPGFAFSRQRAAWNKGEAKSVAGGGTELHRRRFLPAAESLFAMTHNRQRDILAPGLCRDLNIERKSFRRGADAHGCGRPARQIVDLGVAEA